MGLLEDAIREHLDLKRSRGADPAEIERLEREALGPVHREPVSGGDRFEAGHDAYDEHGHSPVEYHDSTAPRWQQDEDFGEHHGALAEAPEPSQGKRRGFLRRRGGAAPAREGTSEPEAPIAWPDSEDPHGDFASEHFGPAYAATSEPGFDALPGEPSFGAVDPAGDPHGHGPVEEEYPTSSVSEALDEHPQAGGRFEPDYAPPTEAHQTVEDHEPVQADPPVEEHQPVDADAGAEPERPGEPYLPVEDHQLGEAYAPGDTYQPGGEYAPGDSYQPGGEYPPGGETAPDTGTDVGAAAPAGAADVDQVTPLPPQAATAQHGGTHHPILDDLPSHEPEARAEAEESAGEPADSEPSLEADAASSAREADGESGAGQTGTSPAASDGGEVPPLQFDKPPRRPSFSPEPPGLAGAAPEESPKRPSKSKAGRKDELQGTLEFDVTTDLGDEDVLEVTPDFLQETPEHDRLWFEQRPPKDFDFDG